MSLADLLPPGTLEDIQAEADKAQDQRAQQSQAEESSQSSNEANATLMVSCPTCHKRIAYSSANPFRPFCSERCKLIDLGAWAKEERTIQGKNIQEDDDGDLLNDPNLPLR